MKIFEVPCLEDNYAYLWVSFFYFFLFVDDWWILEFKNLLNKKKLGS